MREDIAIWRRRRRDVVERVDVRGRMDRNSFDDKGREGVCRGISGLWRLRRGVGGVESEE